MIADMKFRPKASNAKAKRVFLLTLLLALSVFVLSLFLPSYQSVVQLVALVILTVSLFFYNRYLASVYEYEVTTDSDGVPVFVVCVYQPKRTSTLGRIALWDVTEVKRYTREEYSHLPKNKEVATYKYNPTFSPDTITVISVRNANEISDLWIESTEEFDAYFLSIVAQAKEMRAFLSGEE